MYLSNSSAHPLATHCSRLCNFSTIYCQIVMSAQMTPSHLPSLLIFRAFLVCYAFHHYFSSYLTVLVCHHSKTHTFSVLNCLWSHWVARAHPSHSQAKLRYTLITSPLQSNTETHSHTSGTIYSLQLIYKNLQDCFLDRGGKLECLKKTHTCTGRTRKLHTCKLLGFEPLITTSPCYPRF